MNPQGQGGFQMGWMGHWLESSLALRPSSPAVELSCLHGSTPSDPRFSCP